MADAQTERRDRLRRKAAEKAKEKAAKEAALAAAQPASTPIPDPVSAPEPVAAEVTQKPDSTQIPVTELAAQPVSLPAQPEHSTRTEIAPVPTVTQPDMADKPDNAMQERISELLEELATEISTKQQREDELSMARKRIRELDIILEDSQLQASAAQSNLQHEFIQATERYNQNIQDLNDSMEAKLKASNDELETARSQLALLPAAAQKAQAELAALQAKLAASQAEVAQTQAAAESMVRDSTAELDRVRDEAQKEKAALRDALQAAQAQLAQMGEQVNGSQQAQAEEVVKLQTQLAAQQQASSAQQAEFQSVQAQATEQLAKLRQQLTAAQQESTSQQTELQSTRQQLAQLNEQSSAAAHKAQSELATLRSQFEAQKAELQSSQSQLVQLKAQLVAATADAKKSADELASAKSEMAAAQSRAEAAQKSGAADVERLQSELTRAVAAVDAEKQLVAKLQQSEHSSSAQLLVENSNLQQEKASLEGELQSVRAQLALANDQISTATAAAQQAGAELSKVLSELGSLQQDKSSLQRELQAVHSQVSQMVTAQSQMNTIQDLTVEVVRLRQDLGSALDEAEKWQQSSRVAYTQLTALQQETVSLKDERQSLQQQISQLNDQLGATHTTSQQAFAELQTQLAQAQAEVVQTKAAAETLQKDQAVELGKLRQEVAAARDDAATQKQLVQKLQLSAESSSAQLLAANSVLEREQAALQEERASLQQELQTARGLIAELNEQLQASTQNAQAAVEELHTQLTAAQTEVAQTKSEAEISQKDNAAQLESLRQQLNRAAEDAVSAAQKADAELTSAKSEVAAAQSQAESAQKSGAAEVERLQSELTRAVAAVDAEKQLVAKLQQSEHSSSAQLLVENSNLQQEKASLEGELQSVRVQLADLNKQLPLAAASAQQAQNELAKLLVEISVLQQERSGSQQALQDSEAKLSAVNERTSALDAQVQNLQQQNAALLKDLETAQQQLKEAQAETALTQTAADILQKEAATETGRLLQQLDNAREEIQAHKMLVEQLQSEQLERLSALKSAQQQNTVLQEELATTSAKLTQLASATQTMQNELAQQLGESGQLRNQNAHLRTELERIQADFSQMREQLTAQLEANSALQTQLDHATAQVAQSQAEGDTLLKDNSAELHRLRQELAQTTQERDENAQLVERLRHTERVSSADSSAQEQENLSLRSELQSARSDAGHLQTQLTSLQQENATQLAELQKARTAVEQLPMATQFAQQEMARLQAQLDESQAELEQSNVLQKNAVVEIDRLLQELEFARNDHQLQDELRHAQMQVSHLSQQLQQSQAEAEQLALSNSRMEQTLSDQTPALVAATQVITNLESDLRRLQGEVMQARGDVAVVTREKGDLEIRLQDALLAAQQQQQQQQQQQVPTGYSPRLQQSPGRSGGRRNRPAIVPPLVPPPHAQASPVHSLDAADSDTLSDVSQDLDQVLASSDRPSTGRNRELNVSVEVLTRDISRLRESMQQLTEENASLQQQIILSHPPSEVSTNEDPMEALLRASVDESAQLPSWSMLVGSPSRGSDRAVTEPNPSSGQQRSDKDTIEFLNSELVAKYDKEEALEALVKQLKRQVTDLEKQRDVNDEFVRNLQTENKHFASRDAPASDSGVLRNQIQDLTAQRAQLQERLRETEDLLDNAGNQDLHQEVSELRQYTADLQQQLSAAVHNVEMQSSVDSLNRELAHAREQHDIDQQELSALSRLVRAVFDEISSTPSVTSELVRSVRSQLSAQGDTSVGVLSEVRQLIQTFLDQRVADADKQMELERQVAQATRQATINLNASHESDARLQECESSLQSLRRRYDELNSTSQQVPREASPAPMSAGANSDEVAELRRELRQASVDREESERSRNAFKEAFWQQTRAAAELQVLESRAASAVMRLCTAMLHSPALSTVLSQVVTLRDAPFLQPGKSATLRDLFIEASQKASIVASADSELSTQDMESLDDAVITAAKALESAVDGNALMSGLPPRSPAVARSPSPARSPALNLNASLSETPATGRRPISPYQPYQSSADQDAGEAERWRRMYVTLKDELELCRNELENAQRHVLQMEQLYTATGNEVRYEKQQQLALQADLSQRDEHLGMCTRQITQLLKDVQDLDSRVMSQKETIFEKEAQISQLLQTISDLRRDVQSLSDNASMHANSAIHTEHIQIQFETVVSELRVLQEARRHWKEQTDQLQQQQLEHLRERAVLTERVASLEQRNNGMRDELDETVDKLRSTHSELQHVMQQRETLRVDLESNGAREALLRAELRQAEDKLEQSYAREQELQLQVERLTVDIKHLTEQVSHRSSNDDEHRRRYEMLLRQSEENQTHALSSLREATTEAQALQARLQSTATRCESVEAENVQLESELIHTRNLLDRAMGDFSLLQDRYQSALRQINSLEEGFTDGKSELSKWQQWAQRLYYSAGGSGAIPGDDGLRKQMSEAIWPSKAATSPSRLQMIMSPSRPNAHSDSSDAVALQRRVRELIFQKQFLKMEVRELRVTEAQTLRVLESLRVTVSQTPKKRERRKRIPFRLAALTVVAAVRWRRLLRRSVGTTALLHLIRDDVELNAMRNQVLSYQAERQSIHSELMEKREALRSRDQLVQRQELQIQNQQLQLDESRAQLAQLAMARTQLIKVEDELVTVRRELTKRIEMVAHLEQSQSAIQSHESSMSRSYEERIGGLLAQVGDLQAQVRDLQSQLSQQDNAFRDSEARVVSLQVQLSTLQGQLSSTARQLQATQTELADAVTREAAEKSSRQALEQELEDLARRLRETQRELQRHENALKQSQALSSGVGAAAVQVPTRTLYSRSGSSPPRERVPPAAVSSNTQPLTHYSSYTSTAQPQPQHQQPSQPQYSGTGGVKQFSGSSSQYGGAALSHYGTSSSAATGPSLSTSQFGTTSSSMFGTGSQFGGHGGSSAYGGSMAQHRIASTSASQFTSSFNKHSGSATTTASQSSSAYTHELLALRQAAVNELAQLGGRGDEALKQYIQGLDQALDRLSHNAVRR
eukprot:TRINITY_DN5453_c0_g1_i1.p1 TRINITY_DN5453_c0_g1~~TRINITY_DN5453_c0_g1_i1.p1  ORF type:complete len:3012 (-),score=988.49 TRINITY_DN5453_c0_g1_i1:66-9101(-)